MSGESLLRIDLETRTLHAFGDALRLDELYLLLPLVLGLVMTFLLLTLVLGRVWCGWACPQTALVDLAEAFARRIGVPTRSGSLSPRLWQVPVLHGFYLALAFLVGSNLLWYFLSPYDFVSTLLAGAIPAPAAIALSVVGAAVYLDLAFVRRSVCRTVCPYGRFQAALTDSGTLALRLLPTESGRCIQCGACERACPTGIDIRQGQQVGCIHCGRCLDACSQAMARKGQRGIVGYSFGTAGLGPRALVNPRTVLLFAAALGAFGALGLAAARQSPVTLVVRKSASADRVLPGGETAFFFTAYAGNRTGEELRVSLEAAIPGGPALEVRGPSRETPLGPNQRAEWNFAVVAPPQPGDPERVVFRLVDSRGSALAETEGSLRPGALP